MADIVSGFGMAHRLWTGVRNSGPALRSLGRWIFKTGTEGAIQAIAGAGIGIVANRISEFTQASPEQIRNMSANALAAAISVNCPGVNDDEVSPDHPAIVQTILDALADMPDGPTAVAERFDTLTDEFQHPVGLGSAIQSGGEAVGCALGELQAENNLFARSSFAEGSAPANFIRRCTTRSSDGSRVSREPHEYRYCRDSGQIGRVLSEARMQWERVFGHNDAGDPNILQPNDSAVQAAYGEIVSTDGTNPFANISFDQSDYTFGNFVDMVALRSAIERSRKLRRIVGSRNSTQILSLVGLTREQLTASLIDTLDYSELLAELLEQSVQPNSGRGGDVSRT